MTHYQGLGPVGRGDNLPPEGGPPENPPRRSVRYYARARACGLSNVPRARDDERELAPEASPRQLLPERDARRFEQRSWEGHELHSSDSQGGEDGSGSLATLLGLEASA